MAVEPGACDTALAMLSALALDRPPHTPPSALASLWLRACAWPPVEVATAVARAVAIAWGLPPVVLQASGTIGSGSGAGAAGTPTATPAGWAAGSGAGAAMMQAYDHF